MKRVVQSAGRFFLGRFLSYRIVALALIVVTTCSPLTPIFRLPTRNEPITLGVEFARADAYSNGYTYRRTITIDPAQVAGASNLSDFPVLMSFSQDDFKTTGNGGHVTDSQGDDIIFTSDAAGTTKLDHEVERYNASTGEVTMWVKVPTLDTSSDTVIYMFYGNSSVTSSQEVITGTWDSNYKGVWHLHETSGQHLDSTSNNNDSTSVSVTSQGTAAGKFSGADDFNGTSNSVSIPDSATLDLTNVGTIEAWMRTDDTSGAESNFTTWTSRNAPNGGGADDQSGMDSVIVGENIYFGAYLCTNGTEDFAVASSTLSGNRFDNWDLSKMTAPLGDCGTTATAGQEGGVVGLDSDGVHIYFGALSADNATENFESATATVGFSSVSTWLNETTTPPNGAGSGEGNGIDVVIVGNTAYYNAILLTGTTELFASTSRALGSGVSMTWQSLASDFGGAGNENCATSVDSDGYSLYRVVFCHDGADPGNYRSSSTTVGSVAPLTWRTETAPTAAAALADFHNIDMVAMGGRLYHAAFLHSDATEFFQTASSSMSSGGALTWISRQDGSSNPNGSAATDAVDVSVASDGKNLYYAAFVGSATEAFYTASSTLPAHPFISKRNAYEGIQVGTGFAFDWAGRPYTFGTSTNTTGFKHVVITQDGTDLNMYENGVLKRTQTTSVDFESNANNLLIGAGHRSDGTSIYFNGVIDEVRVSDTARSADWISTQYNNQNATSTFYVLGSEETGPATVLTGASGNVSPTSATLFGNITDDAGGSITDHGFATSTSATFLTNVATTSLGAGALGGFQGSVAGLTADTLFYYRAYAVTTGGTVYGSIRTLFTGNSTVTRTMRLFEGYHLKIVGGRMILHQQ